MSTESKKYKQVISLSLLMSSVVYSAEFSVDDNNIAAAFGGGQMVSNLIFDQGVQLNFTSGTFFLYSFPAGVTNTNIARTFIIPKNVIISGADQNADIISSNNNLPIEFRSSNSALRLSSIGINLNGNELSIGGPQSQGTKLTLFGVRTQNTGLTVDSGKTVQLYGNNNLSNLTLENGGAIAFGYDSDQNITDPQLTMAQKTTVNDIQVNGTGVIGFSLPPLTGNLSAAVPQLEYTTFNLVDANSKIQIFASAPSRTFTGSYKAGDEYELIIPVAANQFTVNAVPTTQLTNIVTTDKGSFIYAGQKISYTLSLGGANSGELLLKIDSIAIASVAERNLRTTLTAQIRTYLQTLLSTTIPANPADTVGVSCSYVNKMLPNAALTEDDYKFVMSEVITNGLGTIKQRSNQQNKHSVMNVFGRGGAMDPLSQLPSFLYKIGSKQGWLRATLSEQNQIKTAKVGGYRNSGANLTFGYDSSDISSLPIGILAGHAVNYVKLDNDLGSTHTVQNYLGLYAAYPIQRFLINGSVVYGVSRIHNRRNIDIPAGIQAQSKHNQNNYAANIQLSHLTITAKDLIYTPSIKTGFAHVIQPRYKETGDINGILSYMKNKKTIWLAGVGMTFTKVMRRPGGALLSPQLELAYDYDRVMRGIRSTFAFVSNPIISSTDLPYKKNHSFSVGLSSSYKTKNDLEVSGGYRISLQRKSYNNQLFFGLRQKF